MINSQVEKLLIPVSALIHGEMDTETVTQNSIIIFLEIFKSLQTIITASQILQNLVALSLDPNKTDRVGKISELNEHLYSDEYMDQLFQLHPELKSVLDDFRKNISSWNMLAWGDAIEGTLAHNFYKYLTNNGLDPLNYLSRDLQTIDSKTSEGKLMILYLTFTHDLIHYISGATISHDQEERNYQNEITLQFLYLMQVGTLTSAQLTGAALLRAGISQDLEQVRMLQNALLEAVKIQTSFSKLFTQIKWTKLIFLQESKARIVLKVYNMLHKLEQIINHIPAQEQSNLSSQFKTLRKYLDFYVEGKNTNLAILQVLESIKAKIATQQLEQNPALNSIQFNRQHQELVDVLSLLLENNL
jgi:ubiquinone biosynthesis protein Coq4